MANNRRIEYTVGFNVDRAGLNTILQELQKIRNMKVDDLVTPTTSLDAARLQLGKIKKTAQDVELALKRSFDVDLGTTNVVKLNQELKKLNVNKIYKEFSQLGREGQNAFMSLATQALNTNTQLKRTNEWLTKISETMTNTIRWGITSSMWNSMTTGLSRAYGFAKSLDKSLNDIRIVTQKSAEDMDRFAVSAISAAKELKTRTTDYTTASLI